MFRKLPHVGVYLAEFDYERGSVDDIKAALLLHGLVLIRGRTLTPAEQVEFTGKFGYRLHSASPRLRFVPEEPRIFRMSNRPWVGNHNNGNYWHQDGLHLADPTAISVHHIVNATTDGATRYMDAHVALLDASKEPFFGDLDGNCGRIAASSVTFDCVCTHPATKLPVLRLNLGLECAYPQADAVRRFLNERKSVYRHVWQPGDTIIVDNFRVMHCATAASPVKLRTLHRTSIPLSAVWYNGGASAAPRTGFEQQQQEMLHAV